MADWLDEIDFFGVGSAITPPPESIAEHPPVDHLTPPHLLIVAADYTAADTWRRSHAGSLATPSGIPISNMRFIDSGSSIKHVPRRSKFVLVPGWWKHPRCKNILDQIFIMVSNAGMVGVSPKLCRDVDYHVLRSAKAILELSPQDPNLEHYTVR